MRESSGEAREGGGYAVTLGWRFGEPWVCVCDDAWDRTFFGGDHVRCRSLI